MFSLNLVEHVSNTVVSTYGLPWPFRQWRLELVFGSCLSLSLARWTSGNIPLYV